MKFILFIYLIQKARLQFFGWMKQLTSNISHEHQKGFKIPAQENTDDGTKKTVTLTDERTVCLTISFFS